jgi:hypothetical protein
MLAYTAFAFRSVYAKSIMQLSAEVMVGFGDISFVTMDNPAYSKSE